MQLTVSRGKLLGFEKERVVEERQGVKHIKVVLGLKIHAISNEMELSHYGSRGKSREESNTFLARIKASVINAFSLSLRPFSCSSKACSVA